MDVPFVDLKVQYKQLEQKIQTAVTSVFSRGDYILGKDVSLFEQEFNSYLGMEHGVAVASGTDALHLALRALDISPGDEVIVPANTYIATFLAVSLAGGVPVPVDIDPDTYNIDPNLLEPAITSKTKAIIVVHLYGQPVDMEPVIEIAQLKGIPVIEDACQAHGATYKGKKAGTIGKIGCFSFYPSKNLGCYGDGGYITTNDQEISGKIQLLRNYGQSPKNVHKCIGYNSRLDTLQASILRIKLPHLDSWNESRKKHAKRYTDLLRNIPLVTPTIASDREHVFHLYVVRVSNRDNIQQILTEQGIQTGIHYPIPPHLQKAYKHLNYSPGDFPVTEKYAQEILSLPMYPELTDSMIDYVVESIENIVR